MKWIETDRRKLTKKAVHQGKEPSKIPSRYKVILPPSCANWYGYE